MVEKRTRRRRGVQNAKADRADVQDVAGKNRQERDRSAEEHGEQVERHRSQHHLIASATYRTPVATLSHTDSFEARVAGGRGCDSR